MKIRNFLCGVSMALLLNPFFLVAQDNLGNHTATTTLNMNDKSITNAGSVRVEAPGVGSVRLHKGNADVSGHISIFRPNGVRSGYIGFHRVDLNYVAQNGAEHVFTGGNVNIGGPANTTLITRLIRGKSGNNLDHLFLNYNTGKNVIVGGGGLNSNLEAHGSVRAGRGGNVGSARLIPGSASNSGHVDIHKANGVRLGYIGFNNTDLHYVSENGAKHVFRGADVNIGGESNRTLITRIIRGKNGNAIDHLYLNYNTGKNVVIGGGGQNSNLTVTGNITATGQLSVPGVFNSGSINVNGNITTGSGNIGTVRLIRGGANNSGHVDIHKANGDRLGYIGFHNTDLNYVAQNGADHLFTGASGSEFRVLTKARFNNNISVNGKIESREMKVTTTPTADFVFENDYDLPTLASVEKHIKEKKHLPEIASALEMKANGVNVGEFQIQLLQKIEELTLYIIEQEKRIEKLEKSLSRRK